MSEVERALAQLLVSQPEVTTLRVRLDEALARLERLEAKGGVARFATLKAVAQEYGYSVRALRALIDSNAMLRKAVRQPGGKGAMILLDRRVVERWVQSGRL